MLNKLLKTKEEYNFLEKVLSREKKDIKILDVGCGYGNKLTHIHNKGYDICGVEKNLYVVNHMKQNGYKVYNLEEFETLEDKKYDLIIMSHIIEHFEYTSLKEIIEYYLEFLKESGKLVIYTPTLSNEFYVDFDHVKPYHPQGIKMVFGGDNSQVQFYSKYRLKLVEFQYRKVPLKISYTRKQLLGKRDRPTLLVNLFLGLLFRASFGLVSRTTGWMGVFQKVKNAN